MPGLADRATLADLISAARRGTLTPSVSEGKPAPGRAVRLPRPLGKQVGQILVSDVKSRFSTGTDPGGRKWRPLKHPRPNGGNMPLRDTGLLMASFTHKEDSTGVTISTTHPGAALHNFGGVVRAKNKMLAIPLTKEAKRSGGPRRFKKKLEFRPTKKRRVFLLVTETKGVAVGQFLLVDQVRVPRREFLGVSPKALAQITHAVGEYAARAWRNRPVR